MKRAFYIGRFQPYHYGHDAVIKSIAKEIDELVIGIGSAQRSHSTPDPFTAGERVLMISAALEDLEIPHYIIPIEDVKYNSIWPAHVRSMTPPFELVYSNNPLVIQLFSDFNVKVKQSPMYQRAECSGTRIREKMLKDEDWEHLVPDKVVEIIKEINGIQRLKNVTRKDH